MEQYRASVDKFLASPGDDLEALAKTLMGVMAPLNHIGYHLKSVRRPLDRTIDFCYEQTPDSEETTTFGP